MKCKFDDNGICEVAGIPCKNVFICSNDGIWIDKEDEDEGSSSKSN